MTLVATVGRRIREPASLQVVDEQISPSVASKHLSFNRRPNPVGYALILFGKAALDPRGKDTRKEKALKE
jgi:hypothetical protein